MRTVEDQSAPILEEVTSELGRGVARQLAWSLCSQSPHGETVVAWDKSASWCARGWAGENVARSKGQPWPLPYREVKRIGRLSPGLMAHHGKSIAKQSEGRAGEKVARSRRRPSPTPVGLRGSGK